MFATLTRLKCPQGVNFRLYVHSDGRMKEENQDFNMENRVMNEYFREYYLRNKEKISAYKREYRNKNKEKMKEYKREYYLQNKEKINGLNRKYKNENKEKLKENSLKHNLRNKDKMKEYLKAYKIQNKEKINDYLRNYYFQNQDKMKQSNREHYIQNKEKIKQYNRAYSLKNKDKIKQLTILKNIERNNGIYIPSYSWKSDDSVREYFERISSLLHINDLSDWYRISVPQIAGLKGGGMFNRFNTLGEALKVAYPEYDWDMSKFSFRGKKSIQRWLYVKLKKLLPNVVIEEEYHHPELLWEEKKRKPIQLDIWISQYNLALEYQGEHHYYDLPGAYGPGSTIQIFNERDEKKKQLCASKGINLVCIPYWWDGHEDSLSSTLHTILPDVFQKTNSPPIPANLPTDFNNNE